MYSVLSFMTKLKTMRTESCHAFHAEVRRCKVHFQHSSSLPACCNARKSEAFLLFRSFVLEW